MASRGRVQLATVPANTHGADPSIVARGQRDFTTGSIIVEVPEHTSYLPPDGWRVTGVYASSSGPAKVFLKRDGGA